MIFKFIISLTDYYQASSYRLGADDGYFNGGYLSSSWFQDQYRNNYLPYVNQVVSDPQLKSDPRIFAWELGNELKAGSAPDMINFVRDVACSIQTRDTNHMVTSGFLSSWHATNGGDNYADDFHNIICSTGQRAFDFGNIHGYNNEWVNPPCSSGSCPSGYQRQDQDYNWWKNNNVPYVIGELSFGGGTTNPGPCTPYPGGYLNGTYIPPTSNSRKGAIEATVNTFFNTHNADGILQWGFRANNNDDDTDCLSMDRSFHDYQELFDFYKAKAAQLGPVNPTTPLPTTPTPSSGSTRIHTFALGLNNVLLQRSTKKNGSWGNWQEIGSPTIGATSDPGVVTTSGRIDVFIRGGDNALWQRSRIDGIWSNWASLGGGLQGSPDAAAMADNKFDVVIKGNDNHVYRKAFRQDAWRDWTFLDSPASAGVTSDPSIVIENRRQVIFVRGYDGALWRREINNGVWSGWISMGGSLTSAPDAASYGPGHMDVVIRGSDNTLYHRYYLNGTWYDWAPLGAPPGLIITEDPSISAANGRVDVFVRASDNALWQRSYINDGWGPWISLGGTLTSGPDASAIDSGSTTNPPTATPPTPTPPPSNGHTIHAFGLGDHNILWQRTFSNGSWATWQQIGSPAIGATSDPGVVASSGRLDVFVRGGDNALWQRTNTNGTWGSWTSLGGGLKSAPDAASPAAGQLDVVKQGNDFHIYRRAYRNGTWLNWEFLSSPNNAGIKDEPSIVVEGNRLIVFARGMDNALWRREHSNGGWGSWISMGGGLTSAPDAASYGAGHIDVVIRGNDNSLYHRYYLNGTWYDWAPLGAPNGLATSSPSMTAANGRVDVFVRGADNALWQRSYINDGWGPWSSLGGTLTSGPDASSK